MSTKKNALLSTDGNLPEYHQLVRIVLPQKHGRKNYGSLQKIEALLIPGNCFLLDISSVKGESLGAFKFWLLIIDDCTVLEPWSCLQKQYFKEKIVPFIKELA